MPKKKTKARCKDGASCGNPGGLPDSSKTVILNNCDHVQIGDGNTLLNLVHPERGQRTQTKLSRDQDGLLVLRNILTSDWMAYEDVQTSVKAMLTETCVLAVVSNADNNNKLWVKCIFVTSARVFDTTQGLGHCVSMVVTTSTTDSDKQLCVESNRWSKCFTIAFQEPTQCSERATADVSDVSSGVWLTGCGVLRRFGRIGSGGSDGPEIDAEVHCGQGENPATNTSTTVTSISTTTTSV